MADHGGAGPDGRPAGGAEPRVGPGGGARGRGGRPSRHRPPHRTQEQGVQKRRPRDGQAGTAPAAEVSVRIPPGPMEGSDGLFCGVSRCPYWCLLLVTCA